MKRIELCLAHMGGQEQKYIQEAFDSDWVVPLGPNVEGFEKDLKAFMGQGKEILALSAGTAAVHLALVGCGVGVGDEVIVQSFTFCASANPVVYQGATPVFVDSEADTWNMDPDLLEAAIRDRLAKTGRLPKAIVPVGLYGMPYQVDRILEVAGRYGIPVVEDSAEALGSRFDGRLLGTFGKFGVLSFNGNKMITTSGGGALVCPDAASRQALLKLSTQAREPFPYYQHEEIGYNYRMSNICAGIGRGQMQVLDAHIAHHRHVHDLYHAGFAALPGVSLHENPSVMPGSDRASRYDSNFWLSTITLDPALRIKNQEALLQKASASHTDCEPNDNVEALRQVLAAAGVDSRPLWKPLHLQPVFQACPAYLHTPSVSEALFRKGLCLPSGPRVSDAEVQMIIDTIAQAIER